MGIEEGTCSDEHWVLYGNQFDNKFHIKKKERKKEKHEQGGIQDVPVNPPTCSELQGVRGSSLKWLTA